MPEAAVSQLAVYSSRPTIRIDEQDFDRAANLLIGMDMQEQEGGLSSMQLRLKMRLSYVSVPDSWCLRAIRVHRRKYFAAR